LKTTINNIGSYDLVFIGSPIWWSRLPPPVVAFISEYDLSGKTIVPFCTHLGSCQGQTVNEISKLCQKSVMLDGIAVRGTDAKNAQDKVS
jgi:flavodoxin